MTVSDVLQNYSYYMKILLDVDKLTRPMNYASIHIPVKLDQNNFDFTKVRSDGFDIVFTDEKLSKVYPHEVELFSSSDNMKYAILWVSVDVIIEPHRPIMFYMFYGNANQNYPTEDKNRTWKDYIGVWHFNQLSTEYDSSINIDTWSSLRSYPNGQPSFVGGFGPFSLSSLSSKSNKYIQFSTNSIFQISEQYTIESLVYLDNPNQTTNTWLGTRVGCDRSFDIKFSNVNGQNFHYDVGNCSSWMDTSYLSYSYEQNWYSSGLSTIGPNHGESVLVHSQVNDTIFPSGGNITSDPVFACSNCQMRIGAGGYSTEHLQGYIDELRICNKYKPIDNLFYEILFLYDTNILYYDQDTVNSQLQRYGYILQNF